MTIDCTVVSRKNQLYLNRKSNQCLFFFVILCQKNDVFVDLLFICFIRLVQKVIIILNYRGWQLQFVGDRLIYGRVSKNNMFDVYFSVKDDVFPSLFALIFFQIMCWLKETDICSPLRMGLLLTPII